ncbi:hypothetical protein Q1695_011419 [Nippostrongylus brasiliensis]|nr:hypothetical protein Q1695_011419 [Nippostrongylus brasiliensis]
MSALAVGVLLVNATLTNALDRLGTELNQQNVPFIEHSTMRGTSSGDYHAYPASDDLIVSDYHLLEGDCGMFNNRTKLWNDKELTEVSTVKNRSANLSWQAFTMILAASY